MEVDLFVWFLLMSCSVEEGEPDVLGDRVQVDDEGVQLPWWAAGPRDDADQDGRTVDQGDCDDLNARVHPGVAVDGCDGVDEDCDGLVDEDVDGDAGEWEMLGDLSEQDELLLTPFLFPSTDTDAFEFYVDDPLTGYFDIEIWLYQVPVDADYRLSLYWIEDASGANRGLVETADAALWGGIETINYGGLGGRDDSGWYRVEVDSFEGASCEAPYHLQWLIGGW